MFAAGFATVAMAPAQVGAEPEPLLAANSTAIPIPVVPALIRNDVVVSDTNAIPTTVKPELIVNAPAPAESAEIPTTTLPDPAVRKGASLSELVASLRGTDPGDAQMECLAGAIYFEAKSESLQGQLAVGHVIANRAKSGRYPSTYCGVVYQRSQFSFVRGRSMPPIARGGRQWANAVAIAKIVDQGLDESPVGKALFFHARYVSPKWGKTRVASIGNHIFYR